MIARQIRERLFRRKTPGIPKAFLQICSAKSPEGCIPRRALAGIFFGAARNIPALDDPTQKTVGDQALTMGARQILSANSGFAASLLELAQNFQRLSQFFCGSRHIVSG